MFSRNRFDDEFWEELEEALIIVDVGIPITMALVERVRERVDAENLETGEQIRVALREEITRTLNVTGDLATMPDDDRAVVLMAGVNGAGKTTSIAKLINAAQSESKSVIVAAADTFRAGAIEQIKIWGERLKTEVIAHEAGGDPGAVTYDALHAGKARNADLVIIDTAGRLQTSKNLMAELSKVARIVDREKGDYTRRTILVIDSTTGQNGLVQARAFNEAIGCDGVFLSKLDGTAKGGIVLAITGELGLPVWFVGTGENIDDIGVFDADEFARALVPEPA